MEHLSYKGGCGIHKRCLKEKMAWAIDKWLQIISNANVIKNNYTTKNLKE